MTTASNSRLELACHPDALADAPEAGDPAHPHVEQLVGGHDDDLGAPWIAFGWPTLPGTSSSSPGRSRSPAGRPLGRIGEVARCKRVSRARPAYVLSGDDLSGGRGGWVTTTWAGRSM